MSSYKKTPLDRVKQYSKTNPGTFSADKATLFCKICSKSVDHTRKCVIDAHLASKVHQSNLAVTKETPQIAQAFTATSSRLSQWSDLVGAFTSAGVPLHVFDNEGIRNWFQKYANNGGNLPSVSTLRRNLTDVGTRDLQTTIDICRGRDVVVIVDESTDIKTRKVVNVLLKPLVKGAKARLVGSSVVTKCDAVSVANAVLNTIQLVDVSTDNLVGIKRPCLVGNRLVHSTCWSHVLHLLAEEVRGTFQLVDKCIANLNASLVKAPSRRSELLLVLERKGMSRSLPPFPVLTRWCTWLKCAEYVSCRFDAIKAWATETEDNSQAVKKLKKLLLEQDGLLRSQLSQIDILVKPVCSTLRLMEGNHMAACEVWNMLESINLLVQGVLPAPNKLDIYLTEKHPGRHFWRDEQCFDPRKMSMFSSHCKVEILALIAGLSQLSSPKLSTFKLLASQQEYSADFNVFSFWSTFEKEMPTVATLAKQLLVFPTSTSDVERSFSCLRRIYTHLRSNLSEENLDIHMRLAFNAQSTPADVETSWDDDN